MSDEPSPPVQDEEVTRYLRVLRHGRRVGTSAQVGCGFLTFVGGVGMLSTCMTQAAWPMLALCAVTAAAFFAIGYYTAAKGWRKKAVRALALHRDKRIVPAMLEALDSADHLDDRPAIRHALLTTLPLLTREDTACFSFAQLPLVAYHLPRVDAELACTLLDAIERMAATWALPDIERLLRRSNAFSGIPRIRESAARCEASLRSEIEQSRSTGRLLRPAEPSPASDLLRSTQNHSSDETQLLLRPDTEERRA